MNVNDYSSNYDRGTSSFSGVSFFAGVMTRVYAWMTAALLLTAGVAYLTVTTPAMWSLIYGNSASVWILMIAELGIVFYLSARINSLQPSTAAILFLVYSALNGLMLSSIFLVYAVGVIYQAFAATALTFGGMSLFGYTTKKDLSGLGGILMMCLIGLIIASLVNMFFHLQGLDVIITYVGVFIFVGLTAYDTQKIKNMSTYAEMSGDSAAAGRVAILGALSLYLDFINLFLYLLRLFASRRD